MLRSARRQKDHTMGLNIAIIGSGIAGLSSAWYLGRRHRVTIFEKANKLGMGQKNVPMAQGDVSLPMDIPPRVTNSLHYPYLYELLREVDLNTYVIKQEISLSSVAGRTYLAFETTNFRQISISRPKVQVSSALWLAKYGKDLVKFYHTLWTKDLGQILARQTLGSYLKTKGYHKEFIYGFLYPMWSLICTCTYDDLNKFPARDMLKVLKNFTSQSKSRRIEGGIEALETKLATRVHRTHLNNQVEDIQVDDNLVKVRTGTGEYSFDHVIVATEPAHAIPMLSHLKKDQEVIKAIPYAETEMLLHKDASFMPSKTSMWAPVNLFWDSKQNITTATMWMNKLENHALEGENIFQTWNPLKQPKSECIIARRSFKRSMVTVKSSQMTASLRRMMKNDVQRRVWYVGSYVEPGVPLLENGVRSAIAVTNLIENATSSARRNRAKPKINATYDS